MRLRPPSRNRADAGDDETIGAARSGSIGVIEVEERERKPVGGGSAWAGVPGVWVGVVVPGLDGLDGLDGWVRVVLGQDSQRPVSGDLLQHGQGQPVSFSSRIRVWRG